MTELNLPSLREIGEVEDLWIRALDSGINVAELLENINVSGKTGPIMGGGDKCSFTVNRMLELAGFGEATEADVTNFSLIKAALLQAMAETKL